MDILHTDRAAGLPRGLTGPARVLAVVACLVLFTMMVLTFVDVVGRYVFLAPVPAAYEIVSLMMPAIIFCALPLTMLREGHVTVDLLDAFIPDGAARLQGLVVNLISTGALGLLTWRLGVKAYDDHRFGSMTDELFIPVWPFGAAMTVLCAVATLAALVNVWAYGSGRKLRG